MGTGYWGLGTGDEAGKAKLYIPREVISSFSILPSLYFSSDGVTFDNACADLRFLSFLCPTSVLYPRCMSCLRQPISLRIICSTASKIRDCRFRIFLRCITMNRQLMLAPRNTMTDCLSNRITRQCRCSILSL